jgi:adenylate cyclase
MERRLAAILAADVVGYSRLMGEDEAGTLAAITAHRKELIDPKVSQYNGRIVKLMGDGALMEFASAVDAVSFAAEVQCIMQERNKDVPKNRQIVYRIGINIGDIIIEGDDIFGDGVNVAARLEGLAEPGGICIARNVFKHIKNKLDVKFQDMGEQKLKNIAEPVRTYQIVTNYEDAGSAAIKADEPPALPDKPSIAVLPFDNISGDPDQEYFADGITEGAVLSSAPGATGWFGARPSHPSWRTAALARLSDCQMIP